MGKRLSSAVIALALLCLAAVAPPLKYSKNYVVTVIPFGDSITFGVGDATEAGWRSDWYFAALARGQPIFMIGTLSNAGNDNDLAIDPYNEGTSGITALSLNTLLFRGAPPGPPSNITRTPDVWTYMAGTNDLDPAVGNFTVVQTEAHILAGLNGMCANLDPQKPWTRIGLFEITQRLDSVESNVLLVNANMPTQIAASNCPSKITLIHTHTWNGSLVVPADPSYYEVGAPQHFNRSGYALVGAAIDAQMAPIIAAARP